MKKPQKAAAEKPVAKLDQGGGEGRACRLAAEIARHNQLYYQKDAPEISDAAYDALVRRNQAIEARFPELRRADSPSEKVGARRLAASPRSAIPLPMLSLDNAFEEADVRDFFARVRRFLGLSEDDPVEVIGRAQDRRALGQPAL